MKTTIKRPIKAFTLNVHNSSTCEGDNQQIPTLLSLHQWKPLPKNNGYVPALIGKFHVIHCNTYNMCTLCMDDYIIIIICSSVPLAVSSVTLTSTIKSCDGSSFIVIVTDNKRSSSATEYSDSSNDTTNRIWSGGKLHTYYSK